MASDVKLTPRGQRVAYHIQESMRSGARRADDVQRAILRWLEDQEGEPATVLAFVGNDEAIAWGVPFTEQEVNEAAEFLIEREYIQAFSTDQLGGIRPRITARGRAALRTPEMMISQYGGSNQTTYNNSNNVTVGPQAQIAALQAGGHGNVQIAEQTIGAELRSDLGNQLAELIKLSNELPDETPNVAELRQTLADMSIEVAKPEPRRGVLKDLAFKGLAAGATALGSAGVQQLVELLGHTAHGLAG